MGTPLYTTDIIPLTSRPTLTVMDDGDYFVILDTNTGKISKILKTNLVLPASQVSYNNATSGLTAETVQSAIDEIVSNLSDTDDALDTLKGVGYTEGSLKTHEDRLDTLEGADTVSGSVAKTVKDAVEPIIDDVSDHESRLDTTELTLARTNKDLASVKQTLQQGNGATLDFSGIGSVTLDARATGRANPTVEGRTATNLVENGDFSLDANANGVPDSWIVHGGTASTTNKIVSITGTAGISTQVIQHRVADVKEGDVFYITAKARVTNSNAISLNMNLEFAVGVTFSAKTIITPIINEWYDIGAVVTIPAGRSGAMLVNIRTFYVDATGNVMQVDGNYGVSAINLTSIFGAGNEPSEADCAKIFSYFDGTKSIQLPARIISKSEDESEISTLYLADNEEVRSVPAIADEVKVVNGQLVHVKRVSEEIHTGDYVWTYDSLSTTTNYWGCRASIAGVSPATHVLIGYDGTRTVYWSTFAPADAKYIYTDGSIYTLKIPKTEITIAGATPTNAEVDAWVKSKLYILMYQLATPIITPLLTSGILKAFQNGSVYYEPYYEGSHQTNTSSQITLPYTGTIDKLTGYDENLEPYEVPSTGYTLVGTTLTVTGAEENEVFYVELSRSEPLAPEIGVNTLNNMVVPTIVNASTYTVLEGDHTLLVNYTATGACTINIPTALILAYKRLVIKDSGGGAATKNIIIGTQGTEKIDGADTYVINTAKGKVELASDGANMWVVG